MFRKSGSKTDAWRAVHALWLVIPVAAAVVAYTHRASLVEAVTLIRDARAGWLVPAAAMIGGVYLARASAYRVPLRVLGYTVRRRFLWATAVIATSLHQLIPTAGASGYAFLTYALHRRGVAGGQASLIALIDTLSYATAMATLVAGTLLYLPASGTMRAVVLPGLTLVAMAGAAYVAQRRRRRCERLVLGVKNRLGALLGRRWPDAPVRAFLDEYYAGKAVIARRPGAYLAMVGFQYAAVACDAAALYCAFLALPPPPAPGIVFLGLVVAMAGGAVLAAPAGGGGFEVIMSAFFVLHGVPAGQAIAATVVYRAVAFWLPVAASLAVLLEFRRRRRDIRRRG